MDLPAAEPLVALLESAAIDSPQVRLEIAKDLAGHLFADPSSIIQRIDNGEPSVEAVQKLSDQLIAVYRVKRSEARVADALLEDRVLDRVAARLPKHMLGKAMWAVVALQLALLGVSVPVFGLQISQVLKTKAEAQEAAKDAKFVANQAKEDTETYKRQIDRQLNDAIVMKADAVAQARDRIVAQGVNDLDLEGLRTRIAQVADAKVANELAEPLENLKAANRQVKELQAKSQGLAGRLRKLDDAEDRVEQLKAAITGQRAIMSDTATAQIFWSAYKLSGGAIVVALIAALVASVLSVVALARAQKARNKG